MTEQRKAVIKNADMSEVMQQDAVDVASLALSKYNIEKVSMQDYGLTPRRKTIDVTFALSHFFLCRSKLNVTT